MTKIFAHRGASAVAPENTMAAFQKAVEMGADGLELDVQLSHDGHVVVCHDERVERTSNGRGLIRDLSLAELKRLDFGRWFGAVFVNEKIPTLDDVMVWIKPTKLTLNIEIKNGPIFYAGIEEKVAHLIHAYDLQERVIVSSFYHPSLIHIAGLCPGIQTGALFAVCPIDPLAFVRETAATFLHPCRENLEERWVRRAKERGIGIHVWTVNTPEEYALVAPFAVDGVITNDPEKMRMIVNAAPPCKIAWPRKIKAALAP